MTTPDPTAQPPATPPPAGTLADGTPMASSAVPVPPDPAPAMPPVTSPAPAWSPSATPPPPVAASPSQAGIVAGLVLVIIGALFLVGRVVDIAVGPDAWPLWIVVPGLAMLVGSLLIPPRGGLGLAIPGAIVLVVGLVLWVQQVYGLYATWAYAWALVAPGAPGLGMLVYGLARGDRELVGDGFRTFLVGLGLFLGFGLFFEGVIGLSGERVAGLQDVLPYAVIGLGALMVVLSLVRRSPERRW